MTSPSVTIVIPSLHGNARLARLAAELVTSRMGPQVIVADNGLDERSVRALRSSGVEIVAMERNCGFAAAVNRGAARADGTVLVVMNDDVQPCSEDDFVALLVEPILAGSDMAAAVLVEPLRPDIVQSAGIELDRALNAHDYLRGLPVDQVGEASEPPLGPCGGAAAYRRELFLGVGGFDEGFFAYWEDVDLAVRMRTVGATCGLAHAARATHDESLTLGPRSLTKATIVGRSRGYFLRKYGVLRRPRLAFRVVPAELAVCAGLAARHRSLRPARARLDGWRTCRGRAAWPPTLRPTVGWFEGARRRYARAAAA